MKVKELIEKMSNLDPDTYVYIMEKGHAHDGESCNFELVITKTSKDHEGNFVIYAEET